MSTPHASDMLIAIWSFCEPEDREAFVSYLAIGGYIDLTESNQATGMGGGDVDRSATRASSAVEVGATNSPDGANGLLGGLPVPATEVNVERTGRSSAYTRTGRHGTPHVSGVTGGETHSDTCDRAAAESGVTAGETAPNSNPQPKTPGDADKAEAETPPTVSAAPFKPLSRADQVRLIRPNCQHPGTDLCAGSGRNHCHACKKLMESEAA